MKTKYILPILFFLFACTDQFEEINENPNAPTSIQPSLLLRQVIYDYGEQMSYEGFVAGNLLSQHFTMVDFNLFDRHDLNSPQLGGNPWPIIYTNLKNNELIIEAAQSNPVNQVYEGPALILKAYMAAALTDIYGDVPFFEALQGEQGTTTPAYDAQEQIYLGTNGILELLENGINSIENYQGTQALEGDILFRGDLAAWVRLANSLRIKYLMRISGRTDVSNELQGIVNAGNFISNNTENAVFDFFDTQPNTFRMAVLRSGDFNLYIMSETIQEIVETYNDPRTQVWFRPSENDNGNYLGLRNGPDASSTSISVADYSLTGTIFRENTGALDANFMTAWETHFLLAEAAQKGFINGNAKEYYDVGVEQAFEYWNTSLPTNYLSSGNAGFDVTNGLEQIITQKWMASVINGYEGWIEYRRTGFPELKTVSASLNNGLIPVRFPYPANEAAFNTENYNAATAIHQNSVNAPVWWDVE